eukprot:1522755-Prymnesium_polylepis.1
MGVFSWLEHAFARYNTYAGSVSPDALVFSGRDGLVYANDEQFHIKGVNWCALTTPIQLCQIQTTRVPL